MKKSLSVLLLALAATSAQAGNLDVSVEIPRLDVAEYHRPYVALWLQQNSQVTNLAVWYDVGLKEGKGQEWLKDIRQWWRRSGRGLEFPIDGVTGATRAPGTHTITFDTAAQPLADLPPGDYQLVVEAAREVGGRELVSIPFTWPLTEAQTLDARGSEELGAVQLRLTP
ncbi:MAG: DUF2271 domain-containing protein [Porticoccaceae bacterium]